MSINSLTIAAISSYQVVVPSGITWNPSDKGSDIDLTGGDLIATSNGGNNTLVRGTTSHSTGKYYFEVVLTAVVATYPTIGICDATLAYTNGMAYGSAGLFASIQYDNAGALPFTYRNGAYMSSGISTSSGDRFNVAVDFDANKIWFGKNGTWILSGNPGAGTNQTWTITGGSPGTEYFPAARGDSGVGGAVATANFASASWIDSAPSGFGEW